MPATRLEADFGNIWRMLPPLKDIPAEMLRSLPVSTVLQLNEDLARETRNKKLMDADAKLQHNAESLAAAPTKVAGGLDNRGSILHEARFLGGAGSSAQCIWLKAREVLGTDGVPALGNYDMDAIGCGGSVTARGWQELHNLASPNLNFKFFHMGNVGGGAAASKRLCLEDDSTAFTVGDSLKEIMELEEFKRALSTAREAMSYALPWNKSISAISGFMQASNFCSKDLSNRPNKAALLTAFTNYFFTRNAQNWINKLSFLTINELAYVWTTWFGKQPVSVIPQQKVEARKPSSKSLPRPRDDLCRRFNSTTGCPNSAADCKTTYGNKLRHLCNMKNQNGKPCEKDHLRHEHNWYRCEPRVTKCISSNNKLKLVLKHVYSRRGKNNHRGKYNHCALRRRFPYVKIFFSTFFFFPS
jgi:hypothetical protein